VTEPPNFLERWSRLKRRQLARQRQADAAPPAPTADRRAPAAPPARNDTDRPGPPAASDAGVRHRGEPMPAEDSLPPLPAIDAIVADTDIKAFLRAGVPAELTKAALRRAWTSDPAIRDFIGLAENQWDFTDPTTIPGFGPLPAGAPLGRLLAQALGQDLTPLPAGPLPGAPAADLPVSGLAPATPQASPQVHGMPERQVHGMPETNETDEDHGSAVERQQQSTLAAMQHPDPAADKPRPPSRRSHGGALPK